VILSLQMGISLSLVLSHERIVYATHFVVGGCSCETVICATSYTVLWPHGYNSSPLRNAQTSGSFSRLAPLYCQHASASVRHRVLLHPIAKSTDPSTLPGLHRSACRKLVGPTRYKGASVSTTSAGQTQTMSSHRRRGERCTDQLTSRPSSTASTRMTISDSASRSPEAQCALDPPCGRLAAVVLATMSFADLSEHAGTVLLEYELAAVHHQHAGELLLQVKLFSETYQSDILVASPLAVATLLAEQREDGSDFLSSIEVVTLFRADVMLMQNWAHVETVFAHLNKLPQQQHDTDVMRVRCAVLRLQVPLAPLLLCSCVVCPHLAPLGRMA
jgi:Utp25, U3 small nucleolar RNA-associated SSU processome protein 25